MWELPSWSTAFPFSCAHCFGPPVLVLCEGTESYYRLLNLKNLMEKNPKQTKEVNWQYGGYFCHISEVTFVVFINIQNLCASKTDFFFYLLAGCRCWLLKIGDGFLQRQRLLRLRRRCCRHNGTETDRKRRETVMILAGHGLNGLFSFSGSFTITRVIHTSAKEDPWHDVG